MNKPENAIGTDTAWYSEQSGSLDAFEQSLAPKPDTEMPHATEIQQGVPIYEGGAIAAMTAHETQAVMSEWAGVLLDGPGVIVIKSAYSDLSVVDRATGLFTDMIAEQRDTGEGGGDHFAKPGANDRIWNALQKHCLRDPEGFALYYGNPVIAAACQAWLGPNYQLTAQVNRVNPGGAAQAPHRDYHLGFMSKAEAARYPAHVHRLSAALTLQGAVAHCDMPTESGPTLFLPYSQRFAPGYLAFGRPEFQAYFAEHHVQLPLAKGDAVFFNPALMHGAGANRTSDIFRMANLLQISSAFGRAMEAADRSAMSRALYAPLLALCQAGRMSEAQTHAAIAACAEGYAFPTNLDTDPPVGGLAPASQAALMAGAITDRQSAERFNAALDKWETRRAP